MVLLSAINKPDNTAPINGAIQYTHTSLYDDDIKALPKLLAGLRIEPVPYCAPNNWIDKPENININKALGYGLYKYAFIFSEFLLLYIYI